MEFESLASIAEKYIWVEATLTRFRYFSVTKKAKGEVRKYMSMVTKSSLSTWTLDVQVLKEERVGRGGSVERDCVARVVIGPHLEAELPKLDHTICHLIVTVLTALRIIGG